MDCKFIIVFWPLAYHRFSCNCPIVDQKGRIIAVLVGQPKDASFISAAETVFESMVREGKAASFLPKETLHCQGAFPAINMGVTHGKGTLAPVYLNNHRHTPMMERLLDDPAVQRLAAFASGELAGHATAHLC